MIILPCCFQFSTNLSTHKLLSKYGSSAGLLNIFILFHPHLSVILCITKEKRIKFIICGEKIGRDYEDQIILYAVGGMPIEDVAWGYDVYKNATEMGLGTKLNLWNNSQL